MQPNSPNQFLDLAQKAYPALPLGFDVPLVIVGGGDVDQALLTSLAQRGLPIVGADGGGEICLDAGILPQAIIGDMDSIDLSSVSASDLQIYDLDEQETTDFEKCLYATHSPMVIALGMTGKRLDHTLAALDAAARYARNRPIMFIAEQDVAIAVAGRFAIELAVGARLSVHPLQPVEFELSEGLTYPLNDLRLEPGVKTGTSNRMQSAVCEIVPRKGSDGSYLVAFEPEFLDKAIEQLHPK